MELITKHVKDYRGSQLRVGNWLLSDVPAMDEKTREAVSTRPMITVCTECQRCASVERP